MLHSQLPIFQKRLIEAKNIVAEFLARNIKSYASISGGKDSVAMAHLIWTIEPQMKFMSLLDDSDFPGLHEYVNGIRQRYNLDLDIVIPGEKLWEIFGKYDFTDDVHSPHSQYAKKYFFELIKKYKTENGYEGVFLGLRAQESRNRCRNFIRRGEIYFNRSWHQWICQPLARWEARDVLAYLFKNEISIFDIYFKTKFCKSPENIRMDCILPSMFCREGKASWLRYYYPDVHTRLVAVLPKLRSTT